MSDTTKPHFDAMTDAERLRAFASGLTYNDKAAEAQGKHTLLEVAMRLETGGYLLPVHCPTPTDLQAKIVQQVADVMPVVLSPAVEADAAPVDDHPSELSVAVWEAVQLALGDAYDCQRVWSAWQIGTMHAEDFIRVADQPSRVDEIASAVLGLLPPSVTKVHTWADMEAISDETKVDEALQAFSEDPTGDHGVFVVAAILGAVGLKANREDEGVFRQGVAEAPESAESLQVPAARRALQAIDGMQSPFASYLNVQGRPHPEHIPVIPFEFPAPPRDRQQPDAEGWQRHARMLAQYRPSMSYNDSYFGEPAGLLKQVVAELERLMPPHPVKADTCVELERGLDERLADFIKTASVTSKVDEFFGGEPHIELMLVYGAAGPDVFSAIKLFRSKDSRRTLVEWCRTISRNELWRFASVSLTICNRAVYGLNVMTQILSPLGVVGFDPGFPCFKESSKDRFVNQRAQSALGMYEAFSDGRIAFLSEDLRDGFFDEAIKGELNLCFDHLGRYKVNNKTDAAPILTGLSMAYSEFIPFDGGQA